MVDPHEPFAEPLVLRVRGKEVSGDVRSVRPPIVVFNGCYGGAAWILTEQPP